METANGSFRVSQNQRHTNTCLYNLCLSLTYTQNPTHIHIIHLGRERDTSHPCPVGLSFCPGLSVFSPTMPAHLWSTGPLPGSSASSCGCAAHLCSLQHNRQNKKKMKKHIQHHFVSEDSLVAQGKSTPMATKGRLYFKTKKAACICRTTTRRIEMHRI